MNRFTLIIILLLQLLAPAAIARSGMMDLQFQHFSTPNGLPNSKVHRVLQDEEGFVWIATYYGLFRYDGYEVVTFKSNLHTPGLLPHNNVLALCHDTRHRLWIGTQSGLCAMDDATGSMSYYKLEGKTRQRIHDIIQTRDGNIYIGTVRGLFRFDEQTQRPVEIAGKEISGASLSEVNIQSIAEDINGELLIATWTNGIYRYQPSRSNVIHYDVKVNQDGMDIRLQRLLCDSQNRIWLTTFRDGLLRLYFSKDRQQLVTEQFKHDPDDPMSLSSDDLRGISENNIDHSIWVGTIAGVSTMQLDPVERPKFINHVNANDGTSAVPAEVNDIICDKSGQMWMATESDGVFFTNPFGSSFDVFRPSTTGLWSTDNVDRFFVDDNGDYWFSTGLSVMYHGQKGDRQVKSGFVPNGIFPCPRQKAVMVAVRDKGLSLCRDGVEIRHYGTGECTFLPSNNVYSFCEDKQGNWWAGTFNGLGVQFADGRSYRFDPSDVAHAMLGTEIDQITLDHRGELWLSTSTQGVIRMSGRLTDPDAWQLSQYSPANGKLPGSTVFFVFCDHNGRIWAGLEGYGLCLYDEASDSFHTVHQRFNLPGDMANTMLQDEFGNLWLGTNQGLASLTVNGDSVLRMRIFTKQDGLPDNFFNPLTACQHYDMLYFGCGQGLVRFRPADNRVPRMGVNCHITSIRIDGKDVMDLPADERRDLCDFAPLCATEITLPARSTNLGFRFASLTYKMPQHNRYAYRLLGYDDEWKTTDAVHREANFSYLSPGSYTFEVKGTNENGDWSVVRQVKVNVLSPWWKMWWAWLIYLVVFGLAVAIIYSQLRYRMSLREELRIQQIESDKAEEINRVKLQFFANITHELMTPLTIISASLDELRQQSGVTSLITTMDNNVQRLMRLLQQILEFRKAETGNLRLRVAKADLALFVQHKVESFTPLINKQQLHLSCVCQDQVMMAYFDPDKLDKILYNLLSNAAKYTQSGGAILINLNYTDGERSGVELIVKDTGRGMSPDQQKGLFRRFYDGAYRQSHTIGTGIGLSLVHDLVELHKGTISVESEEGKGTSFTIVLPITEAAYDPEQIIKIEEETRPVCVTQLANVAPDQQATAAEGDEGADQPEEPERTTLLLVEDNDELLGVMTQLLSRDYRILQATNGVEALQMLQNEDVSLVITDVVMPEMDGVELTRRIKQDVEICHIPVIMLTAKRADDDRDAGFAAGADAYLTKPFSLPALQARIQSLLRTRQHDADDFRRQFSIDTHQLHFTDIDEQFLARAIECVNRHIGDASFDVQQFANELGASRSTLYKKLHSLTGLNPTAFVRNIRLKAACQIIQQNPSVRINELAYSMGFNDPKYFSICFKKEFGIQPTEYSHRVHQGSLTQES